MIQRGQEEPAADPTVNIDGSDVPFTDGETLYEVCSRQQKDVPTLCYDPRLDPFGGCRLCVVELEGARNPVASCTTRATAGMTVRTETEAIEKHRRTLLELVVSENRQVAVDELAGYASQELKTLVDRYDADRGRFKGKQSGHSRDDDDNPFILRDYDQCISCYRCVRVCAEQEGDYAISVMNRGFETRITTEFNGLLRDSDCTFCGQCIQTCPTGALADKKALSNVDVPGEIEKTRSICPYCGVGCSVDLVTKGDKLVGVQPAMDGPANEGALCVKGQFAFGFVQHDDRLKTPMVRGDDGELHTTSWDDALDRAADGLRTVVERHGREALYAVASGRAPHEAAYTMQKIMRAGWGLNQIDNCSRA
ncbi:MAG: 2Fe-2S iron-sulfur cluster-binding protein [Planctomycetota bacterium]|nr:2Fe-2S iron-sulfur cluster-binding protein [Planctomycetota bacterium]